MPSATAETCAETKNLAPAGLLSRAGKLIMGLLQIQLVFVLGMNPGIVLAESPPANYLLGFAVVLAFGIVAWTVNLGFDKPWGKRPFYAAIAALGAGVALTTITTGGWWGVPTALVLYIVTVYVHGHMGVSHVLAAILGTPGCEMRAIPQVWSKLTRAQTSFRVCPGIWTPLDNWEFKMRHRNKRTPNMENSAS